MGLFTIIGWLFFGLIVGAIARFIVPGRQTMSWLMTIALGVAGSFVGGAISWLIFGTPDNSINPSGWIMSIVGAIVLILIYSRMSSARTN